MRKRPVVLTLALLLAACREAPPPSQTASPSQSASAATPTAAATDSSARADSIARDSARADSLRVAEEEKHVVMSGYVVRGSDESSFKVCGKPGVHLIRDGRPAQQMTIYTQYRFRATEPLRPVYFTVKGRIVQDTATVGSWFYKSIIQISYTYPDDPKVKPACAPPARGSLIEREMAGR